MSHIDRLIEIRSYLEMREVTESIDDLYGATDMKPHLEALDEAIRQLRGNERLQPVVGAIKDVP